MTPADQLSARMGLEVFTSSLVHCLCNGYVTSTPEFFFMGRAVPHGAEDSEILDFAHVFPVEQCDAWFVAGMAGDMKLAMASVPYPLPWFVFQRDSGPFRRYNSESLTLTIQRHGKQTIRTLRKAEAGRSAASEAAAEAARRLEETAVIA